MFWDVLLFSLSVTAPIFAWLGLGIFLKILGWLNETWINRGSWLIFYVSLPLLMFTSMVRQPLVEVIHPQLTAVCVLVTLVVFVSVRRYSRSLGLAPAEATVFVQGTIRGNLGIIGISLCLNAYGESVLVMASLLMALLTILYNVLSIYTFVDGMSDEPLVWRILLRNLLSNPLILAILAGLPFSLSGIEFSIGFIEASEQFVSCSLPLALVCIGASLSYRGVLKEFALLYRVTAIKLVLMPVLVVAALLMAGYRGPEMGVPFLLLASPVAAASYIVAKAYGANASLAANTVVITTIFSLVSISIGIFALKVLQLM